MESFLSGTLSASNTNPGYAWEFLRRNKEYRKAFDRSRSAKRCVINLKSGGKLIRANRISKAARKWGLETFANPAHNSLEAFIFWSKERLSGALPIEIDRTQQVVINEKRLQISDFSCTRHHFLTSDGTRHTVLKTSNYWLQLYGRVGAATKENGHIIARIEGHNGMRKRLNTLQILAGMREQKQQNLNSSQSCEKYRKLQFYLGVFDLKIAGASYQEIAQQIFGQERVEAEWRGCGCSLKSLVARAAIKADRLVAQDYRYLLEK